MAYSVDTYNRAKTFVVQDGTVNNELDIRLVGKNFSGYGEIQNENILHLLENFAGLTPPSKPINGQIWYDAANKTIKVWDSSNFKWKASGSIESNSIAPTGLAVGDLWWDNNNNQLFVYNGSSYTLIGPENVSGTATTQVKTLLVTDTEGVPHPVIVFYAEGKPVYVVSSYGPEFELNEPSKVLITGISGNPNSFTKIYPGITLANTNSQGISLEDESVLWGTASYALNSEKFAGFEISEFVRKTENDYGNFKDRVVKFGDEGYTLGEDDDLEVFIDTFDGTTPIIKNAKTNTLKFQVNSALTGTRTPLTIVENDVLPGLDNITSLGSDALRFKSVYADKLYGDGSELYNINVNFVENSNKADFLKLDDSYVSSSIETVPSTIVARTTINEQVLLGLPTSSEGSVKGNYFIGTATSALFADLAEKYLTDVEYEVGTVVSVGGSAEVTACKLHDRAFGAVSANPAYMMNAGLEGGTYIAIKGRVPVKVIGPVKKGDKLIAADNGCVGAVSELLKDKTQSYDTFAIALENNSDSDVKLVEAIIL